MCCLCSGANCYSIHPQAPHSRLVDPCASGVLARSHSAAVPANPHAKLSAALFLAASSAQCPGVLDAPASDSIWAHPAIKACQ
eukprot:4990241-Amphidinium_carterae.1